MLDLSPWRASSASASACSFGLAELRLGGRGIGLLRDQLVLDSGPQTRELRFGGAQLRLDFGEQLCLGGIAQFEDDGIGRDCRAGAGDDPFDPAGGHRREPPDLLGDEGPQAPDVADHRPPLDRVHPDRGALDRRRGRLQPRQDDCDRRNEEEASGGPEDAAISARSRDGRGALDIDHIELFDG